MSSLDLFNTEYTQRQEIETISKRFNEPEWMLNRREKAFSNYESLPMDKDTLFYKYTSFRKFDPTKLVSIYDISEFDDLDLDLLKIDDQNPTVIETESGIISELSEDLRSKGVYFGSLHELMAVNDELAKSIVTRADEVSENFDKLGELSKSFASNILVLYIPKGVQVDEILHKSTWLSNQGVALFSEFIIILEEGSSAKVIDTMNSGVSKSEKLFINSQTIILGENSRLLISQVQDWDEKVVHASSRFVHLKRFANLRSLTHMQGGEMVRHNSNVDLIGDGSEGYDLFVKFGNDKQRFDVKSELHHIGRDTIGNVHARTVMMNRAESILRGLIIIAKPGVNTDSWLTSRGMTMGKGKIVAIPALNIDQNDVKAAHAASVEPLNEELLFYLTTRGVPHDMAREMLVKGYFEYILKLIKVDSFQKLSRSHLTEKWNKVAV